MAGPKLRRRHPVHRNGTHGNGAGRNQYRVVGGGGGSGRRHDHANPLRQTRRFAGSEWLGGRTGRQQRGLCLGHCATAVFIGLVGGVLVIFAVEMLEVRLAVDDPSGAVSVHAVAGIWGVLALGFFARFPGAAGQGLAQLIGVATLLGFVLPFTYGLNWLLNRFYPQRAPMEGERLGMDVNELGATAYPEFVIHTEEFIPR